MNNIWIYPGLKGKLSIILIVCSNKIYNRVMPSGERKENYENTIGLIGKKATLHVQHTFCTFLCLCFARLQRETSRNFPVTRFMEEMPLTLPLIFTLVAASISHFPTAATKFYVVLPTKKCLLCLLSLPLAVCRSFSR